METRAPYALIGLFVMAVIGAAFGFVYWLHNGGGLTERTIYRVHFENTVSGLLKGASVLFNGIRVGEVTDLQLERDNPQAVTATIAVDAGTPVRADTKVGLDFQGLTGVPVVTLQGGSTPLNTAKAGEPHVLVADPSAGQSMTNAARDTLRRLDTILAENAEPIRSMIGNINTFSGALARNSDKLDGIVSGLERLAGGGKTATTQVYDLTAPTQFRAIANAPCPVPVPRSSALDGAGSTSASAASYGARCVGSRIVSQLPAMASNCLRTSGRKKRQSHGLRRTAFVARRANFWPRARRFKTRPDAPGCPDLL